MWYVNRSHTDEYLVSVAFSEMVQNLIKTILMELQASYFPI